MREPKNASFVTQLSPPMIEWCPGNEVGQCPRNEVKWHPENEVRWCPGRTVSWECG